MNGYKGLTTMICVAALGLGLAACGGGSGTSGMRNPVDPGLAESIERATALNVAIEAAQATVADGTFDDTAHMVAPTVAATNDGMAVTVGVTEGGMRQSGNAGGSFAEREDGPAPIAGWTGARFERGTAIERLTVYTDVGPPEAMAFTPGNLNRLNEVSGLTGGAIPEGGLAVEAAYWPLVRSTSLEAAPARGSVTHGATGTGADEGLSFIGVFSGAAGGYSCSGTACSVTLDDTGRGHRDGRDLDLRARRGRDGASPGLRPSAFRVVAAGEGGRLPGLPDLRGRHGLHPRRGHRNGRDDGFGDVPGRGGRGLRVGGRGGRPGDRSDGGRVHGGGDADGSFLRRAG